MTKPIDPEGRAFQKALDEVFTESEGYVDHLSEPEIFELGWDAAVEWMKQKQKEDQ